MSATRSPFGSITTTPRPASASARTSGDQFGLAEPVAPMMCRLWRASGPAARPAGSAQRRLSEHLHPGLPAAMSARRDRLGAAR